MRAVVRSIVILTVALFILGSCGLSAGIDGLARKQSAVSVGDAQGGALAAALVETRLRAPHRRPLAAAGALVSMMFLAGAFLIVMRRKSAPWWIAQAAIANGLWALADGASHITGLMQEKQRVAPLLVDAIKASQKNQGSSLTESSAESALTVYAGVVVLTVLARCAFYLWVAFRGRGEDVRAFLEE